MKFWLNTLVLFIAAASCAFAGSTPVPEINGSSAAGALALISGAALVLRGRRRK